MRKTGGAVVDNVYSFILQSEIPNFISGDVYKNKRPTNNKIEDCIIMFRTGLDNRVMDGNTQSGALSINIYVPFIDNGTGIKIPNQSRITEIEMFVEPIFRSFLNAEYLFTIGNMIQHFDDNEIEQSFIYVDLRFVKATTEFI